MSEIDVSTSSAAWCARGSRPIWLAVLFWIVVDAAVMPVCAWADFTLTGGWEEFLLSMWAGSVVGQSCFLAVVTGLRWRTWSMGYAAGVTAIVSGQAIFLACLVPTLRRELWDPYAPPTLLSDFLISGSAVSASVVPAVLFSLAAPLMTARFIWGWRLGRPGEVFSRERYGIEDLLSMTALVGVNLVFLRTPPLILRTNSGQFWISMLTVAAAAFGIGLVFLPLCVRFILASRSRRASLFGLSLLSVAIPVAYTCISQVDLARQATWQERIEPLWTILPPVLAAIATSYTTLAYLKWSGFSLRRLPRGGSESSAAIGGGLAERRSSSTRWVTGVFIMLAMGCSMGLARLERWRETSALESTRLDRLARQLDGAAGSEDDAWFSLNRSRVTQIQLGAPATDSDLDHFRGCRFVTWLNLSESQVTDAGLAKLTCFPELFGLDLSNTQVSNEGLEVLNHLTRLMSIYMNDTKIGSAGIARIRANDRLAVVALDQTLCDDRACRELQRFPNLHYVALRGTAVTERGLEHLAALPRLRTLLLGDTSVSGDALSDLKQLRYLELPGTRFNDSSMSKLARMPELHLLDLSRTAVTDDGLHQLRNLPELYTLKLDNTAITGAGFRNWIWRGLPNELSLSHSAFNDTGVRHLRRVNGNTGFHSLDLSHSQVTDACLKDLAAMRIHHLDLSQTSITSAGLMAAGMANVARLQVAPGQFSDDELADMRQALRRVNVSLIVPE